MADADDALDVEREWFRVALSSIGDAVITTDTQGRVTFLNPVAQSLTGWSIEQARGVPLDAVFKIVNEETRNAVENPALTSLRVGLVVGLANHTLLISNDGTERPIDDSAAPIFDVHGEVVGVVLVFRDVTARRGTERALQASEQRFRLLVEGVRDYAIVTFDPQGFVTSWNAGAQHIKGYQANEIIGKHFSCFYPPDAVARGFPDSELKAAAEHGRFEHEGWRVRKDGSKFWASMLITAIRDEASALKGFSSITRDLTERRNSERALRSREERLRVLMQTANDAIITADDRGRIVSWNKAASEIFGYSEAEVVNQSLTLLMPERYRDAHRKGLARFQSTGQSRLIGKMIELEGLRSDGSEFPIELSLATWRTAEGQFYTGIVRDITERRKNEDAQREVDRARAVTDALADLNRRKDEFLAMLSHELRNPLSPILNSVHLLRMPDGVELLHEQAIAIIERQVGKLTHLVDDLLEVSRISTGRIRLKKEVIDLRDVVDRAVETVRPMIAQRKHELAISCGAEPIWLDADPARLEQVLVNLLTNAAKYTHDEGCIELTIEREGNEAVLRVKDNGVGIGPELLPSVFDLFTQAEQSLDRSQGGLGIGLSVVQRVVEMHGGKVMAFSEGLGQGSEFTVRLSLAPAPPPRTEVDIAAPAAHCTSALRVLVVDDNKDAADTTAALLRRAGHEVQVSYSGQTAMVAALDFLPHAALLDIGLPVVDGIEIARRFRESDELKHVQLIAVTGYGQETDRPRSQEAGFDAYLVKPVDPQKIEEALAAVGNGSLG